MSSFDWTSGTMNACICLLYSAAQLRPRYHLCFLMSSAPFFRFPGTTTPRAVSEKPWGKNEYRHRPRGGMAVGAVVGAVVWHRCASCDQRSATCGSNRARESQSAAGIPASRRGSSGRCRTDSRHKTEGICTRHGGVGGEGGERGEGEWARCGRTQRASRRPEYPEPTNPLPYCALYFE